MGWLEGFCKTERKVLGTAWAQGQCSGWTLSLVVRKATRGTIPAGGITGEQLRLQEEGCAQGHTASK